MCAAQEIFDLYTVFSQGKTNGKSPNEPFSGAGDIDGDGIPNADEYGAVVSGGGSYRPDGRTRTFEECFRMLAGCAAGDGNRLLNVGPPPTGEILPEQVAVLKKMGAWLATYGDSIYATRGGPFHNGEWGGATYKDKTIYLHIFRWKGDTLELPPLRATRLCEFVTCHGS